MRFDILLLLILSACVTGSDDSEEPVLYYYGLEESERGLAACGARQACSALARRYWRAPARLRLCRCALRQRCAAPPRHDTLIPVNDRVHFQFCQPVTDWPECVSNENALTVVTSYNRINPDEIEEKHHANIQLVPPKITFKCRCQEPNYWKLSVKDDTDTRVYRCSYLPICKTGEFCGNVDYDLNALYQSCLCPRNHICVHSGGVPHTQISELLYDGKGWKAFCQRIGDEYSYDEY